MNDTSEVFLPSPVGQDGSHSEALKIETAPNDDGDTIALSAQTILDREIEQSESAVDEAELAAATQTAKSGKARSARERISTGDGSMPRTPAQKPLSFQLEQMEVGRIHGTHPMVWTILAEVDIPLRDLSTQAISVTGLLDLACHLPLHVVREEDKIYCVGGLRLFRLMRGDLSGDTVIPVFVHAGLKSSKLRNQIFFDLYVMPVVTSLDMKDRKSIAAIWDTLQSKDLKSLLDRMLQCERSDALSMLLNCDLRTTRKAAHASNRSQPE